MLGRVALDLIMPFATKEQVGRVVCFLVAGARLDEG
jgi:hypothetical protein